MRIAQDAETRSLVEDAGQPVKDRVDVRADMYAPMLEVVAGVADDRQVLRRQHMLKPRRKASAPSPSGKQGDLHRKRSSSGGRTRSPPRPEGASGW